MKLTRTIVGSCAITYLAMSSGCAVGYLDTKVGEIFDSKNWYEKQLPKVHDYQTLPEKGNEDNKTEEEIISIENKI